MKDEELADRYAEEYFGKKTELVEVWKLKSCKDNFLAGLKAGRPQWHKVADGDLPKIGKPCFVYLANDCVIIARLREDNVWTTDGHNAFENVIAWCEIPTFDKE